MRKVAAAAIASTLMLSAFSSLAAGVETSDNRQLSDGLAARNSVQSQMFDGINLTEHQRQQMRDLMQQSKHEKPSVNISEMETMHRLVTAEKFDERAVRAQAEKIAQEQVARQVEMARVRNQMYRLLTPEQQAVLKTRHEQRMQQLRDISGLHHSSSVQLLSSSNQ
ncbi:repressor CpxP [Salmonella enterica subsp. enterica serovar Choleraesuis]|nr:repressor CpxP [Salmonella enterica subsp. enterica serovar Choleraesuis]